MALFNTSYRNSGTSSINTGGLFNNVYKSTSNSSEGTKNKFGLFTNYSQYTGVVRWQDIIGKPTSFGGTWGSITGTVTAQTDLMTYLSAVYQPIGNYATANNSMTFTNKSGNISMWNNDTGYITSSSLTPYLTIVNAAATYQPIGSYLSSVTGTSNRITSTGGLNPIIDIATGYVGQTSITTLGTISTGTWNGSLLTGIYGGTGVDNGTRTLTYAGNVAFTGANNISFTTIGAYTYTLPSATSTLLQTSSTLNVTFGTVLASKTITGGGGSYPFYTALNTYTRTGGNSMYYYVIERAASTFDMSGFYNENSYTNFGYKTGSTYYHAMVIANGTTPYISIGYTGITGITSGDSLGTRLTLAVNGGLNISSIAGTLYSNANASAIYASTGKSSIAGDLFLAARNQGNGTTTGSEVHLVTQALKRVTVFYNGQTEFIGATQHPYVTKSTNYTLTDLDHTVEFTAAATATLPDIVNSSTLPTRNQGRIYVIVNNSVGSVTISRNTAGQIWNQGTAANTFTLTTNKTAIIQAGAGTDYRILSVY